MPISKVTSNPHGLPVDAYGLTIPVSVKTVAGVTKHRYITPDDFIITVTDTGAGKADIAIYNPNYADPLEQHKGVDNDAVKDIVRSLSGKYKF
jgi:hypothetical protein